ncbi:MAG: DUF4253 domain-containing protein [Planctomycetota bacterium]
MPAKKKKKPEKPKKPKKKPPPATAAKTRKLPPAPAKARAVSATTGTPLTWRSTSVAGADALTTLWQRRQLAASTGKYPFIVGSRDDLRRLRKSAEQAQPAQEILAAAERIDAGQWFAARRAAEREFFIREAEGEWPTPREDDGDGTAVPTPTFCAHCDSAGEVHPEVVLGTARIAESWQLPAVVRYGNWNACPPPALHCALHRHWHAEYGAEIISMSADVIECLVPQPPTTREAALALAWEQYWYCSDIVEQGCESVSALAAALLDSDYWFFWWD